MSDDKIPQRPDGVGDSFFHGSAPRVEVEPTPAQPTTHTASPQQDPAMPGAVPPTTETVKHTVVKTKTKKAPVFLASFGGLVVGAVLVIALVMSGAFKITDSDVQATGSTSTQNIEIDAEDTTLAEAVAAKAQPSVVSISTTTSEGSGVGSGVVLDTDGNVLTNCHVIEGATELVVSMGGESYEAELVGEDSSSDLAVIRLKDVDSSKLTPIEIGDSDDLSVGEWVMAIGSPFGNEQSVSTGIVSALYRSTALPSTSGTSIYANMIQTDAAINPGNSGGALVNDNGELIGINSIIESYSGSSSGVGFAIPVNYAINIASQIIDGKTPVHPYLGVSLTSVNALSARANNLGATEGALVVAVSDGGPAADAGIQENDIITKIDGEQVASADGLIIALREHEVGDKVTLTVVRDSKEREVEVTLGSDEALQTDQQDNSQGDASGNSMTEEEFLQYLEELMGRGSSSGFGQGGNLG
jgi:putative serine protease PepD